MVSRTITITRAEEAYSAYSELLEIVHQHQGNSFDELSQRIQSWAQEVIQLKQSSQGVDEEEIVAIVAKKIEELAKEILCNPFSSDDRMFRFPVLDRENVTFEQRQLENLVRRKKFSPGTGNPASLEGIKEHGFVKQMCEWVRKYLQEEPLEELVWLERSEGSLAVTRKDLDEAQKALALQQEENELARQELAQTLNSALSLVQERIAVTNANTEKVREQAAALVTKAKENREKTTKLHKEQTTLLQGRITRAEEALEEQETRHQETTKALTEKGTEALRDLGASAQAKIEEGQQKIHTLGSQVESLAGDVNNLKLQGISKEAEHGQRISYMEEEAARQKRNHEEKIRRMENTISDYGRSLAASQAQVGNLKSDLGSLQAQVQHLERDNANLRHEVRNADSGGGCIVM